MRYLKQMVLLAILMMPLTYSQAQVRVGVGVGFGPGYVVGPPVCRYGYFDYAPYACAPYGYYGPSWFSGGVFIGAGPWYHGYYGRSGWGPRYYGRSDWGYRRGFYGHEGYAGRGLERGPERGFRGDARGGFHGESRSGFHGGGGHGGGHR
jgi:hypothetical protein